MMAMPSAGHLAANRTLLFGGRGYGIAESPLKLCVTIGVLSVVEQSGPPQ